MGLETVLEGKDDTRLTKIVCCLSTFHDLLCALKVHVMKYRFLHDGFLNRHESRKLERKLNAASDRIYRFKHNNRQREYRYGGRYRHHS